MPGTNIRGDADVHDSQKAAGRATGIKGAALPSAHPVARCDHSWGGMLGSLGILVGVLWLMLSAMGGTCGNVLYREYPAPDQTWKAVVFQRDCGATIRYSTHIAILAGTDQLTPTTSGNISIIDGQPDEVAPVVIWANPTTLVIHQARTGTAYRARDAFGWRTRIQVVYDQRP